MDINRIDWTKKGLGWIPDLPVMSETDVSDKEQKRDDYKDDEATDAITQLTTQLTTLIDRLEESPKQQDKYKDIRQNLSFLKTQLSENINLLEVQFCKILRKDQTNQSHKEVVYLKQAFLKLYLRLRMSKTPLNRFENFVEKIEILIGIEPNIFSFTLIEDGTEWLKNGEFDDGLEQIVRAFQKDIESKDKNFVVDGIVGLKTYRAIEQSLKECSRSDSEDSYEHLDTSTLHSNQFSIDFLPIPPIIPDGILQIAFDYLRLAWLKGDLIGKLSEVDSKVLINDYFKANVSSILECLNKENPLQELSNEREKLASHFNLRGHNIDIDKWSKDLPKSLDEKKDFFGAESYQKFGRFFFSQFHIIEPLVVAVYQVASPFSGYANPKQAIQFGFNKLENYLRSGFSEKSFYYEPFAALFQLYSGQDISSSYEDCKREQFLINELVGAALVKISRKKEYYKLLDELEQTISNLLKDDVLHSESLGELRKFEDRIPDFSESIHFTSDPSILRNYPDKEKGLKELLGKVENIKKESEDSRLFFDFLEEILKQFGIQLHEKDKNGVDDKLKSSRYYSMLFNKQELFAIPDLMSNSSENRRSDTEEHSLVGVLDPSCQFPIRTDLITSCFDFDLEDSKEYYFFLPNIVDLSPWCSPVKDQGSLNACTALSGVALAEYCFQQKIGFGKHEDLSALFLYKASRELMQRSGNSGASIQATMQAMVLFGIPPEHCWPYQEEHFDDEPSPFCYSYAQNYQALKYFRLDSADISSNTQLVLLKIRATLAAGIPCMFGLTLYNSVYNDRNTSRGYIPYPSDRDQIVGGHTLVAVGYNDYKVLEQANGELSTPGALLVRNSWGSAWGKEGYGWLPYDYVLKGLTADWWSLIKAEWFDRRTLGLGVRQSPGTGGHHSGSFPS